MQCAPSNRLQTLEHSYAKNALEDGSFGSIQMRCKQPGEFRWTLKRWVAIYCRSLPINSTRPRERARCSCAAECAWCRKVLAGIRNVRREPAPKGSLALWRLAKLRNSLARKWRSDRNTTDECAIGLKWE